MKRYLILLTFLVSITGAAEPWDKLVAELSSKRTFSELKSAKSKFYSRMERNPLTRSLDFGYEHTLWEFDFIHGNFSDDFRLQVITQNDSIVFAGLDLLDEKGEPQQKIELSANEIKL